MAFKRIWGQKKKEPTPNEVMGELKDTIEIVQKRVDYLQKRIDAENDQARAFMQKDDKQSAMTCIRRRKIWEAECKKKMETQFTMEQQLMAMEEAIITMNTIPVMKRVADMLASMTKSMSPESVEELMHSIRERIEDVSDISDIMSVPLTETDQEELEAELDLLQQKDLHDDLFAVPVQTEDKELAEELRKLALPKKPAMKTREEEDADLQELERSMKVMKTAALTSPNSLCFPAVPIVVN